MLYLAGVPGGFDLTPLDASGRRSRRSTAIPGVVIDGADAFAYGTDMAGHVVEYRFPATGGVAAARTHRPAGRPGDGGSSRTSRRSRSAPSGTSSASTARAGSSTRRSAPTAPSAAEDVTDLMQPTAVGYSDYQQPFAGRVYSDLATGVDPTTGDLYVYGTNGRDLVEFRMTHRRPLVGDRPDEQPQRRRDGRPITSSAPRR